MLTFMSAGSEKEPKERECPSLKPTTGELVSVPPLTSQASLPSFVPIRGAKEKRKLPERGLFHAAGPLSMSSHPCPTPADWSSLPLASTPSADHSDVSQKAIKTKLSGGAVLSTDVFMQVSPEPQAGCSALEEE